MLELPVPWPPHYNHWATTSPHILLCLIAPNVSDLNRRKSQHGSFPDIENFMVMVNPSLVPPRPLPITYSTGPTHLFVACRVCLQSLLATLHVTENWVGPVNEGRSTPNKV